MRYFYGKNKKHSYFEGWYFKHQSGKEMISIIAAFHIDPSGEKKASIQIITPKESHTIWFLPEDFQADTNRFYIRIGKNIFEEKGCQLDICTPKISLQGKLEYGKFTRLSSDIMGPFHYIPNMQCSHGVISMGHKVRGHLKLNHKKINLNGGSGYIEMDRGSSFPKHYIWMECEEMRKHRFSLMVSVADIPLKGISFRGCICAICYQGKEYRLATYKGVKIRECSFDKIILSQGKYTLYISMIEDKVHPLKAPDCGNMERIINEQLCGKARFRLWEKKEKIFDITSNHVSREWETGDI